jgi:hypothetical protein
MEEADPPIPKIKQRRDQQVNLAAALVRPCVLSALKFDPNNPGVSDDLSAAIGGGLVVCYFFLSWYIHVGAASVGNPGSWVKPPPRRHPAEPHVSHRAEFLDFKTQYGVLPRRF